MGKRIINFLLVLSLLILVFGLNFNFKATNYDIFFHIKTGEYIVKNKLPKEDVFSYTASEHEWIVHEYVPAVIFYFFYKNFGIKSLIFLKALILTSFFFLFFKLMCRKYTTGFQLVDKIHHLKLIMLYFRSRSKATHRKCAYHNMPPISDWWFLTNKNLYLALILTLFAALSTKIYAYIRPHIFFWLFLVVMFILFKYKKYYLLPLLTLFWANFHSSVVIGLIIITIYLLELFIVKKKIKFIYLIIACFITSLINPYTYKIFLLPFKILKFSAFINEWKPYTTESFWFWFYLVFVLAVALIFVLNYKKVKVKHFLVFLLFVILGFKSKRDFASSILVNLIIVRPYLDKVVRKIKRTVTKDIIFLIIILLLIIFSILKLNAFNASIPWKYFGKNAIEFVKNNDIEGNMYNSYELGGPLIFGLPENKVFIDGRIDVYGEDIVKDYYDIRYGENWEDLVKKYNIDFFIIDNKADIGKILYEDGRYSLVFFDEYYSVYVKKGKLREFKVINPYYDLDPKQNTEMIINETEYLISLDPNNVNAYKNLGLILFFEKKDKDKGLYYLNKYLEKNPKDKEIRELLE